MQLRHCLKKDWHSDDFGLRILVSQEIVYRKRDTSILISWNASDDTESTQGENNPQILQIL